MAINIFEGARRITHVVAVAIGLSGAGIFIANDIHSTLYYDVNSVGAPPVRVAKDDCRYGEDLREYASHIAGKRMGISVSVCFKASKADDGRVLIPFKLVIDYAKKDDPGSLLLNGPYTQEVKDYANAIARNFRPPTEHVAEVEAQYWRFLLNSAKDILGWTAAIILGLYIVAAIVGWIVRGFAGIPMGKDAR